MSKSCCPVGRRGDVGAINAALRAGMKVREVASLYGIGKTGVGEHRKNCLRLEDAPKKSESPDEPAEVETSKAPTPLQPTASTAPVPADVLDEVRSELSADKKADSGRGSGDCPGAATANQVVVEAPRARLAPQAKDAKTFTEQSLVCADMIAVGAWEGRASVRWLSALWNLSAEAVRERHRAGAVAAEADRGHIEAERQLSIGALQEQERIALEAFEASKGIVDEEGALLFTAGDPKFLAVAQKARADIARIAGCVPSGTTVNVAVIETPQFATALDAGVGNVLTALQEHDEIARLSGLPRGDVAKVTAAVLQMVARKRLPALDVTGEER